MQQNNKTRKTNKTKKPLQTISRQKVWNEGACSLCPVLNAGNQQVRRLVVKNNKLIIHVLSLGGTHQIKTFISFGRCRKKDRVSLTYGDFLS